MTDAEREAEMDLYSALVRLRSPRPWDRRRYFRPGDPPTPPRVYLPLPRLVEPPSIRMRPRVPVERMPMESIRDRESRQAHGWADEAERHAAGVAYPMVLEMAEAAVTAMRAVGMQPFVGFLKAAAREAGRSLLMSVQQLPPDDPSRMHAEAVAQLAGHVAALRDDGGGLGYFLGGAEQTGEIRRPGVAGQGGATTYRFQVRARATASPTLPPLRPPMPAHGLAPRGPYKSPLV